MEENNNKSWAEVGGHIVFAQINQCSSRSKDNKSLYEITMSMFSQQGGMCSRSSFTHKLVTSEYALGFAS